ERIARWALNTQYGYSQLGWKPVICTGSQNKGDHIILTFDRAVRVHDGRPFAGFAIAGHRRDEKLLKVWSPLVAKPLAVRYAWARNPIGNAVNSQHHERIIPVPSFRTDDWDWPEAPFKSDGADAEAGHRKRRSEMRKRALEWAKERTVLEAREVLTSAAVD
ncbi:MAG: hypothetical protein ACYTE3_17180, partial [Planctomycetota bacterium]